MARTQQDDPALPIHYLNTEDENVAGSLVDGRIQYRYVDLDDGTQLQLFVNRDTNLVVLDLVADKGGNEMFRRILTPDLLAHLKGKRRRRIA